MSDERRAASEANPQTLTQNPTTLNLPQFLKQAFSTSTYHPARSSALRTLLALATCRAGGGNLELAMTVLYVVMTVLYMPRLSYIWL